MQVLLLKTKKDTKTDNNAIYKSKKMNASAYIHHDSRLVEIIKNPCPFRKERLLCALVFKLNIFVTILTAGPNHPPNGSFRLILLLFHISFPNLAKNLGLSPNLF